MQITHHNHIYIALQQVTLEEKGPQPFSFDQFCEENKIEEDTKQKLTKQHLNQRHVLVDITKEDLQTEGFTIGERKLIMNGIKLMSMYLLKFTLTNFYSMLHFVRRFDEAFQNITVITNLDGTGWYLMFIYQFN